MLFIEGMKDMENTLGKQRSPDMKLWPVIPEGLCMPPGGLEKIGAEEVPCWGPW